MELLAVIILLAIVMGIGSYTITKVINDTKEKDYNKLIGEIKNAVEVYYQECRFLNDECQSEIKLGDLVKNGFLSGNGVDDYGNKILVNSRDKENISNCKIKYTYNDGKISVEAVNPSGSCPVEY